MPNEIIQYVGFQTELSATAFGAIWTPIALAFKTRGIKIIDLYQFGEETQVAFMSRNVWKADDYLQVFPSGLADTAAFAEVKVVQFGGYFGNEVDSKDAPVVKTLSLFFTQTNSGVNENAQIFERVSDSVPYQFALENFDTSNEETTLGNVKLMGTHIVRL